MTATETARRMLVKAPGIAICHSCLALGCSTSLEEMREATAVLLKRAGFHRHDRCWSCGRRVDSIVYRAECAHCSLPIELSDETVSVGTDLFHAACLRVCRLK
jgi:ribosomal protein L37E